MTAISHFQKESFIHSNQDVWQTLFQVLGASLFMTLCSQIKLILPFTPVPITCQTLAVLLIGATLGSRKGAWALLIYFAEVLMGLPVLSGGTSDPLIFFGPKGGYVIGFLFQAFFMGWFVEKSNEVKSKILFIGGIISCTIQMGLGICGLSFFVGWTHVWTMGLFPFIPGEILKTLLVCFLLTSKRMT